ARPASAALPGSSMRRARGAAPPRARRARLVRRQRACSEALPRWPLRRDGVRIGRSRFISGVRVVLFRTTDGRRGPVATLTQVSRSRHDGSRSRSGANDRTGRPDAPPARFLGSWLAESFVAEPRVRPNRTQRDVLQSLFDLDLMHPNGLGAVVLEDPLGLLLLIGRVGADPQDKAARGHLLFELFGFLSP